MNVEALIKLSQDAGSNPAASILDFIKLAHPKWMGFYIKKMEAITIYEIHFL